MTPRPFRLALFLGAWANVASALVFTNSFNSWVGNSTYTLTWNSSPEDPKYYGLAIVRPRNIYAAGVTVNSTWPVDWFMNVATQISSTGDHYLKFTLPPSLWPGQELILYRRYAKILKSSPSSVYYMVMLSSTNTTLTPTFSITSYNAPASTSVSTNASVPIISSTLVIVPAPTATSVPTDPGKTTIASYVQVTATQTGVVTKDGHMVTVTPSEVFSSEIVYTTIIVESGESKGTLPGKIPIIVGLVLGVTFLLTLPIIVWLVLKYRRRPTTSTENIPDKRSHPPGVGDTANPSTLDLIEPTGAASATTNGSPTTRQVWTIVDREKRLVTVSRNPQQTLSPNGLNPFADPVSPSAPLRPQQLPRLSIPDGSVRPSNSPPPTTMPNDTPLSSRNPVTVSSPRHPSEDTHPPPTPSLSMSQIQEKIAQGRRQRSTPAPAPRALSPEEISARIFVPGRALDMGPLVRARVGDVDEHGLLPPDYSQATQPISPLSATRAVPSHNA